MIQIHIQTFLEVYPNRKHQASIKPKISHFRHWRLQGEDSVCCKGRTLAVVLFPFRLKEVVTLLNVTSPWVETTGVGAGGVAWAHGVLLAQKKHSWC